MNGKINRNGYWYLMVPGHPKARTQGYVKVSRLVAEKSLGKILPEGAEVHHVDEDKQNDAPNNLVICQDRAYHFLLHQRKRAFEATGDPNQRKCKYCKQWDTIDKFIKTGSQDFCHGHCKWEYAVKPWRIKNTDKVMAQRERYAKKKEASHG